jgi:NADH-quinone oxidoreductase subunit M
MPDLIQLFSIPFISAIIAFIIPLSSAKILKTVAVILSFIPLAFLLIHHAHWIGSTVDYAWLPTLSINFHLSVDALSLLFLYLTALIVPVSLLAVRSSELAHPHTFYGLVLLLQGLLI